ncbi:DNA-binding response regulator [Ahniella affigens]|uniref:DNA-binding response regulator n=1 Tax=Ahniella affigens TaxID=2021234 RepID=A0A2P1PR22_9GAMM|nr:LytTR family DNA-binding domain-containing protein [Ahniella affigens]AVP97275.1 DNA-binding response regulator [Ahniella affigens]
MNARALVADDEPLLREHLVQRLRTLWPELDIVGQARNGREAVELFDRSQPDICFLDVQMPAMTGIEAARHIGGAARLVFVTAFDQYAVDAFEAGALDYLIKPVTDARLGQCVARLQQQLRMLQQGPSADTLLDLARRLQRLEGFAKSEHLKWLRASLGSATYLIPVHDIDYLKADQKYTRVAYHDADGKPLEALIRSPLKDLITQLDPDRFSQIHRGAAVNLHAVKRVVRIDRDSAEVELKGRPERLPVSKTFLAVFRET